MSRRIVFLLVLLLLQLAAVTLICTRSKDAMSQLHGTEPLINIDWSNVNQLLIKDNDVTTELKQQDNSWVVTSADNFPAAGVAVTRLIDKFKSVKKNFPVGKTAKAQKEFKVADDNFEKYVSFSNGEKELAAILFGTAPGFKSTHVRVKGEGDTYALDLNASEIPTKPDSWLDHEYFSIKKENVKGLEFGTVKITKAEDKFTLADLKEKESAKTDIISSLVGRAVSFRFSELLGKELPEDAKKLESVLKVNFELTDGSKVEYDFSGPYKESFYVIKAKDKPFYATVNKAVVDSLLKATRESLLEVVKEEPTPTPEERGVTQYDEALVEDELTKR